ncbi:MAG TPA: GGDEF domain-containing protein [Woeseiaceae bacterium]|nr:GGDEF domain-containing protein [Woeseiaceae bacterium]
MNEARPGATTTGGRLLWQPDFAWSLLLAAVAAVTLAVLIAQNGILTGAFGWGSLVFFLLFGLFTISMGYPHPSFGHVSFDRVAQVASVLVLGPVEAALLNGIASLIWPWHRLWLGVAPRSVLVASLHNGGLMTLVILVCGSLYARLGGPVPLEQLSVTTAGLLLLLLLSMQLANDLGMLLIVYLRHSDPTRLLNIFTSAVELGSGLIAILVAIVYVRMELSVFVLLLVILALGMLVLKKFAVMRDRLEKLVDDRTEALRVKSLELERQATHDKLTGLFNRRYADDWLQREVDASQRANRELTIALADVDHFKTINDTYSHAIGDEVLRRVSRILQNRCRKTDIVARYGGEEFLLCFPDTNVEFAEQICGQIRAAIERTDWSSLDERIAADFRITISFGVAEVGSDSRRTSVLSAADHRLYEAKSGGRNRVVT